MWRWRPKKPNRFYFWQQLIALTGSVHLIVFLLFFFVYRDTYYQYSVDIATNISVNDAQVVFLPLYKTIPTQAPVVASTEKPKNVVVPKKVKTALASPKPKKAKSKSKVKSKPKTSIKKTTPKKKTKSKPKKVKQTVSKKVSSAAVTKQPQAAKAKSQKIKSPVNNQLVKKIADSLPANVDTTGSAHTVQDVMYIGQAEYDALQMQEDIQKIIAQHWKPPAGVPEDVQCRLTVYVDWDGNTKRLDITEPSGVLLYDMQARSAVSQIAFPASARGKEITLCFRQ